MSWYHCIANFLNYALPERRATRRTNLALLTAAILERRALVISVLARVWQVQLPYSHHQRKKPPLADFAFCPTRAGVRLDHAEPTPASGRPATLPLACGTPSSSVPAGSDQISFPRNHERSPSFRFTAPPFPTTCRSAGRRWYTRYPSLRYNSAAGNRPYNRRNVASPRLPTAKSDHRPPSGSTTTAVQIRRERRFPRRRLLT